MFFTRTNAAILLSAALIATPAWATHAHRSGHTHISHISHISHRAISHASPAPASHRLHGQQAIDPARVTEIQQALIRQHYLTTEANGKWDAATLAAMQKYQGDQGWQTKLMPDSRALVKLGLGPD